MVKTILKYHPELTKSMNEDQRTPLHLAAERDTPTLEMLLGMDYSVAYRRDSRGQTAAHVAAHHNNVDGLLTLRDFATYSFKIRDKQLRNAAHYAAIGGCGWEALEFLMKQDEFSTLFLDEDEQGNTPIHLLAKSLRTVTVGISLEPIRRCILWELPNVCPRLTWTNNDGLTPGDIARSFSVSLLDPAHREVVIEFRKVAPPGPNERISISANEDLVEVREGKIRTIGGLKKICYRHLGVVFIIATLSLSASLAPPGGFNQDDKDSINRGTAMLSNNTAFQIFSLCCQIAWIFSAMEFAVYVMAIAFIRSRQCIIRLLSFRGVMPLVSIVLLMAATLAGTYATERQFGKLFVVKMVIFLIPLFLLFVLVPIYTFRWWRRFRWNKALLPLYKHS